MQKVLAHLFSQKFLQVFNVDVDDHLQPMYLFIFLVVYFNLLQDSYNASPMSHISTMVWDSASGGATEYLYLLEPAQGTLHTFAGPVIPQLLHTAYILFFLLNALFLIS